MRITPLTTTYNSRPVFRSMSCDYKLPNKREMGLYTWMFREDVNWTNLAKYEIENFKAKDRVNIIQFAPSDGSEGYTKILSLIQNLAPSETEKFFPIHAYDINGDVVKAARTGYINLSIKDIERLIDNTANVNRYFSGAIDFYHNSRVNNKHHRETSLFKTTDELTRRIEFNHGDMFKILPSIEDESNTIILARNVIGYYDSDIRTNFIKQASNVLKSGSLFIIGLLEQDCGMDDIIRKNGFQKVMKNVYRKI